MKTLSQILFKPLQHGLLKNLLYQVTLLSFFTFAFSNAYSQNETNTIKTVIIKMSNGDEYKGQILERDNQTIVLRTINGEINLIASNVQSIEQDDYKGRFQFANPHDTRYFFGPSGIPIKKGKGYYQNVMVTTNFFNYGVATNFSIGGGFEFVSTVLGEPIWFLTPKVGFKIRENIHIGGGIIMAGFAAQGTATLGYGVFTLGSSESNLSIGAGYGLANGELSNNPAIMFSGTHRVGNSIALLTENYVFPNSYGDSGYFGIHGIRILSRKNSFDVGAIIIPVISDYIPALPYVGYVRVF